MKNKKWVAYTIALNDLIRNYEEIIMRFEKSSIPLDEVFGSNTEQYAPHSFVLAFGSAVEPERLIDILNLLDEYGPDFLLLDEEELPHKKYITIGSYNMDNIEAVPLSKEIKEKILYDKLDIDGLHLLYKQAPKVPIIDNKRNR